LEREVTFTMPKSPAFRFYPSDFIGSPDVQAMDLNEIGAYVLLLCTAWLADRHGYLPDDENKLRRWAKMNPQEWIVSREILLSKFPVCETGFRSNPRMVLEAAKQEKFSASQRYKAGKRWALPGDTKVDPGAMPSVSASVSASVVSTKTKTKTISKPTASHPDVVGEGEARGKHPDLLIYECYPRKEGRSNALTAVAKAVKRIMGGEATGTPMEATAARRWLWKATASYGRSPAGMNMDRTKVPHPATWFNQSRYLDDQSNWQHTGGSNVIRQPTKFEFAYQQIEAEARQGEDQGQTPAHDRAEGGADPFLASLDSPLSIAR
jgi:uncharacterized protein YdaU (DUF1376 family)